MTAQNGRLRIDIPIAVDAPGQYFLRVRGRRDAEGDQPASYFYTNPIRLTVK